MEEFPQAQITSVMIEKSIDNIKITRIHGDTINVTGANYSATLFGDTLTISTHWDLANGDCSTPGNVELSIPHNKRFPIIMNATAEEVVELYKKWGL